MDQGPRLLNQLLGLALPTRELFGFHSARYVVAAYPGHQGIFSVVSHLVVLGGCALLLLLNRRVLWAATLRRRPGR